MSSLQPNKVVSGIVLAQFRQHRSFSMQFLQKATVIIGANASGKTTILEALALAATGNSFRAGKVEEMISFDQELGRCKVKVLSEEGADEVEVILTRGVVQGKRTQHRLFAVNGAKKRKKDATRLFFTVVFRPEDMRLVEGSPSRRRAFLDVPLSALHYQYESALTAYEQTIKRRNKVLQQVRDGQQPRTSLHYWNTAASTHGEILQKYRQDFLGTFAGVSFPLPFSVVYKASVISPERTAEYLSREIAAGHTLIGPHKDDITVQLTAEGRELDVAVFGSRGQQRLAVLWLKYCEIEYLAAKSGTKPLLLLDDIMSELDIQSQERVLETLAHYQSVVTSTDEAVYTRIAETLGEEETALCTF